MKAPSHVDTRIHPLIAAIGFVARVSGVFLGVFSLFGHLYFGYLTLGMIAGGFAFAAALTPVRRRGATDIRRASALIALAVIGLVFQLLDVVYYFWALAIPGSHYSWSWAFVYSGILGTLTAYGVYARFRTVQGQGWMSASGR